MKWNKYKLLTTEQKEEYNFKFSVKPKISVSLSSILFLWSLTIIQMLIAYLIYIETEPFKGFVGNIWLIHASSLRVVSVMAVLLILSLVYDVFNIFIYEYRRKKWLKRIKK